MSTLHVPDYPGLLITIRVANEKVTPTALADQLVSLANVLGVPVFVEFGSLAMRAKPGDDPAIVETLWAKAEAAASKQSAGRR